MSKSIQLKDGSENMYPISGESDTGYVKLADGTLIQWGVSTFDFGEGGSGTKDPEVDLPISFISNNYTALATWADNAVSVLNFSPLNIRRGICTTNKIALRMRAESSVSGEWYFSWLAIGRGK